MVLPLTGATATVGRPGFSGATRQSSFSIASRTGEMPESASGSTFSGSSKSTTGSYWFSRTGHGFASSSALQRAFPDTEGIFRPVEALRIR